MATHTYTVRRADQEWILIYTTPVFSLSLSLSLHKLSPNLEAIRHRWLGLPAAEAAAAEKTLHTKSAEHKLSEWAAAACIKHKILTDWQMRGEMRKWVQKKSLPAKNVEEKGKNHCDRIKTATYNHLKNSAQNTLGHN